MEDTQTEDTNTQDSSDDTTTPPTEGVQTDSAAPSNGDEATGKPPAESDENDNVEIVEQDGKKFIPFEAFEKRIGNLTAKLRSSEALLEAIKTNPEVREQFKEALKDEADSDNADPSPGQSAQPPVFDQWVDQITQGHPEAAQHKSFYTNMRNALWQDIDSAVTPHIKELQDMKKTMQSVMRYIGESSVKSFESQVKDFGKYKSSVVQLMKANPYLSIEQAYQLSSYNDIVKGGGQAASKSVQNKQKLSQTPIAKRQAGTMGSSNQKYSSLDDAIRDAAKETGWTK